jgi:hypothetical protein
MSSAVAVSQGGRFAGRRPSRFELLNPAIGGPMFVREMKKKERRKTL